MTARLAQAGWRDLREGPPVPSSRFGTRVDYLWAREGSAPRVLGYGTLPGPRAAHLSDHLPVAVRLEL